jgi:hypothetical protein
LFVDFLAPAFAATPLFLRLEKAFVYRRFEAKIEDNEQRHRRGQRVVHSN